MNDVGDACDQMDAKKVRAAAAEVAITAVMKDLSALDKIAQVEIDKTRDLVEFITTLFVFAIGITVGVVGTLFLQ